MKNWQNAAFTVTGAPAFVFMFLTVLGLADAIERLVEAIL